MPVYDTWPSACEEFVRHTHWSNTDQLDAGTVYVKLGWKVKDEPCPDENRLYDAHGHTHRHANLTMISRTTQNSGAFLSRISGIGQNVLTVPIILINLHNMPIMIGIIGITGITGIIGIIGIGII